MDHISEAPPINSTDTEQTPFERFQQLAQGLLAVPKRELDEKVAEEKAAKVRVPKKPKPVEG